MAILVNWFEVSFNQKEMTFPSLTAATWEESTPILNNNPNAEIVRGFRRSEELVRLFFVTGQPAEDHSLVAINLTGERSLAARIVEYNLAKHFEKLGNKVRHDHHWGVEATREVLNFEQIGLRIHQGVSAKYFAVAEPAFRHGITLNWVIRPVFTLPVIQLPQEREYDGFPVVLRWPPNSGPCPTEIAPFDGRYVGTIIEKSSDDGYRISLRDQSEYVIPGNAIYLETRTDILAEMERILSKSSGQSSIQRKILQLSHSLKSDGRRNAGILRDQLASALKILDPSDRGQVNIPLLPNAEGEMWINCFATGAQKA
jgi:hypothetical protein